MNVAAAKLVGAIPDVSDLLLLLLKLCVVAFFTMLLRGIFWLFNMVVIQPLFDPMRLVPGPEGSVFQSHLRQVLDPSLSPQTQADWSKRFGQMFKVHGFGRHDYRLMAFDFRSIVHILSSPAYEKPWQTRSLLSRLVGRGIFSMEGSAHRMQRRIIAPAFTTQSIKNMTPVFFQKAEEVCERWKQIVNPPSDVKVEEDDASPAHTNSAVKINVAHWVSRASFDIIGLTGFNYNFHSLEDESEEVYMAYRRMFNIADKGLGLRQILEFYFPVMRKLFVTDDIKITNESLKTISRRGKEIVEQKKKEYSEAQEHGMENKDLLTLLIKSNLSADPTKRLTDRELLDQCSTFLLAGSDTVAMGITWAIHLLSQHPDMQTRLRNEILKHYSDDGSDVSDDSGFQDCTTCSAHPGEKSDWTHSCTCSKNRLEAIESLPFLDCVVRETLRFCPPVHSTIRVAMQDDQIPVSHPVTLKNGRTVGTDLVGHISIRKGTYVHIPIEGFSYSEDVWGPDALEFRPERWKDVKDWDPSKPGINNLMTFGYGPHSCLGHRWSTVEMKAFLVVLLSTFEFLPAEGVQICKFNSILTRPYVKGQWVSGPQLPVMVREIK